MTQADPREKPVSVRGGQLSAFATKAQRSTESSRDGGTDELAGDTPLNWSEDISISGRDGVTVGGVLRGVGLQAGPVSTTCTGRRCWIRPAAWVLDTYSKTKCAKMSPRTSSALRSSATSNVPWLPWATERGRYVGQNMAQHL